jgi:hypothetical protein
MRFGSLLGFKVKAPSETKLFGVVKPIMLML